MAGSLNHIIDENGCFTMEHIEKMHDAHQALDECFNIIRLLTDGDKSKINQVCRALGYPEINCDLQAAPPATVTPRKPVRYVLGLVFNEDLSKVLLLRKNKPANQKGLLNGIGGKIEPGEMPAYAMTRECAEEVGLIIQTYRWVSLPPLEYPDAEVICFTVKVTNEEFMEARQMEEEALKHQILPVSLMDLVPGLADKLDEARLALA